MIGILSTKKLGSSCDQNHLGFCHYCTVSAQIIFIKKINIYILHTYEFIWKTILTWEQPISSNSLIFLYPNKKNKTLVIFCGPLKIQWWDYYIFKGPQKILKLMIGRFRRINVDTRDYWMALDESDWSISLISVLIWYTRLMIGETNPYSYEA